jgi:hypothetical protein
MVGTANNMPKYIYILGSERSGLKTRIVAFLLCLIRRCDEADRYSDFELDSRDLSLYNIKVRPKPGLDET